MLNKVLNHWATISTRLATDESSIEFIESQGSVEGMLLTLSLVLASLISVLSLSVKVSFRHIQIERK